MIPARHSGESRRRISTAEGLVIQRRWSFIVACKTLDDQTSVC